MKVYNQRIEEEEEEKKKKILTHTLLYRLMTVVHGQELEWKYEMIGHGQWIIVVIRLIPLV
eukprot:6330887-Ditylum_brightwellii.AAC.1